MTKQIITFCFLIIIAGYKLYLIWDLPLFVRGNSFHDDLLFVTLANNISEGQWLGPYNDRTLWKGPILSIYLALLEKTNVPLKISEYLVYLTSLLPLLIWFLTKYKSYVVLSLFAGLVIFNPYIESIDVVTREGLYTSSIIFLIGVLLLMFENVCQLKKSVLVVYSSLLGFGIFWFWYLREEGVLIIPILILFLILGLNQIIKKHGLRKEGIKLICVLFLFIPVFLSLQTWLKIKNYQSYGSFITLDIHEKEYKNCINQLYRVKQVGNKNNMALLNKETREVLYNHVPFMNKIKSVLEKSFIDAGCPFYPSTCGDIANGWFPWAIRWAFFQSGLSESPSKASSNYKVLSNEIEVACSNGSLDCYPLRNNNLVHLRNPNFLKNFRAQLKQGLFFIANGFDHKTYFRESIGPKDQLALFGNITNSNSDRIFSSTERWFKEESKIQKRQKIYSNIYILRKIKGFYDSYVFYILIHLSIFLSIWKLLKFMLGERSSLAFIIGGLVLYIISRIALLAYLDTTQFPGFRLRYLSCIYPLVIIVSTLLLLELAIDFRKFIKSRKLVI